MAAHYGWWLIAVALGVAELFTGSFYLLVLATGAATAGFAGWFGAGTTAQLLVAAAVSAAGAALVRRLRPRRANAVAPQASADLNLDIGQSVQVARWDGQGRSRVSHRGAVWDAELMPGEPAVPGRFTIREIEGSRLRLARDPRAA